MMRKIKTALDLGGFNKGDNLLEVGCAKGVYTFEFAKMGFDMTGQDLSVKNIEVAKERAEAMNNNNVNFIVGDAEDLSTFSDNTFDGVTLFSALRYVPNPQNAINEIFRVLKKGKSAVVDFVGERMPVINEFAAIVMCEGRK